MQTGLRLELPICQLPNLLPKMAPIQLAARRKLPASAHRTYNQPIEEVQRWLRVPAALKHYFRKTAPSHLLRTLPERRTLATPMFMRKPGKTPRPFGHVLPVNWTGLSPGSKSWTGIPPYAKWFIGGKLNASYNCVDRHLKNGRRNKAAIIWEGEPGDWQVYTYWDLHREVCKFANGLKSLGVQKGRPGNHLPAHGAGTAHCHAGLRPYRRRPQRHFRRLQRRLHPRPY